MSRTLRGSCACGRNRYLVEVPSEATDLAQVLFDTSNVTRQHFANPFTAWLKVPLDWYRSATFAQFPDETPLSIRRTFTSPFSSSTRRQFCGYCGTQLSSWNERTQRDADFISLTLGSLLDDDLDMLEDMGLMPSDSDDDSTTSVENHVSLTPSQQFLAPRGAPWFESMVQNSRLGRIKKQKGGHTSRDGSVHVEWEVVEWDGNESNGDVAGGKRKHEELEQQEDVDMRQG